MTIAGVLSIGKNITIGGATSCYYVAKGFYNNTEFSYFPKRIQHALGALLSAIIAYATYQFSQYRNQLMCIPARFAGQLWSIPKDGLCHLPVIVRLAALGTVALLVLNTLRNLYYASQKPSAPQVPAPAQSAK